MRNELEQIEKIEHYLRDRLSVAEKLRFEEQIANDPALQEEVRLQQEILQGIERASLKQKIQKAGVRFRRGRNFLKWGFSGLAVILLIAATLYAILYYKHISAHEQKSYEGKALPEYNESGGKDWADADRNLTAQTFWVDASTDTVIETKGGIYLSVPAAAFLNSNGQSAKGKVELIVKEALDPASILRAGLSSKSGNQLLETGGMFFVDARKNGQALKIDPSHPIYAEVPTDTIKPGMQLFSGQRLPDGSIDWTNPRPLQHDLIPVDIHSLDFYPPHYLDSLSRWGYDSRNRTFTDSLYYSFARFFGQPGPGAEPANAEYYNMVDTVRTPSSEAVKADNSGFSPVPQTDIPKTDSAWGYPFGEGGCGINPAKIKAIWSKEFQNTLLSTREFEQRMAWIHLSGNSRVLDLYVNNPGKHLCTIDSMAARLLTGDLKARFLSFAARQDGRVKNGIKQFDKLREYYQKKTTAFTEAIAKTQNDFWRKQAELDNTAGMKKLEHQGDSINRLNNNLEEEFKLNLKEAYRQLGYDTSLPSRPPNRNVYQIPVTNTGWWNVDKYVYESTTSRTSLDYTDPQTAKKAVINYLPVSFRIEKASEYDRLYVYLLPDKLSSFMRLEGSGGNYSERLDELMKYNLVCIGWKGDQAYSYSRENIQPGGIGPVSTATGSTSIGSSSIQLTPIGERQLDEQLNKIGNRTQAQSIQKENSFFRFEIGDRKRQQHNQELEVLTQKVLQLIFPCYTLEAAK